jgi:hypothetical protein
MNSATGGSCVKLLHRNLTSHGGCQWTPGEWKSAPGTGELCTAGWLHFYDSLEVGLMLNPAHANISPDDLVAFSAEWRGKRLDDNGLKFGASEGRIVSPLSVPSITSDMMIEFGILCALWVGHKPSFTHWAEGWLSGRDRSQETAAWAAWAAAEAKAAAWAAAAWAAAEAAAAAAADLPLQEFAHVAIYGKRDQT